VTDTTDTLLEVEGQVTDWLEVGEDLPRVRLTYVPQARWSSIMGRRFACAQALETLNEKLVSGEGEAVQILDRIADLERLAKLALVEACGLSLREVEGFEPLTLGPDGGVDPQQLEALWGLGHLDGICAKVVSVHLLDRDAWRALFRGRLGQPV